MAKKQKREIDYENIKIIHTIPEMEDIDREKSKKSVGNELYEIFLRIQSSSDKD